MSTDSGMLASKLSERHTDAGPAVDQRGRPAAQRECAWGGRPVPGAPAAHLGQVCRPAAAHRGVVAMLVVATKGLPASRR